MGCNQVFDRVLLGQPGRRVGRVTPGHGLFYFFINPARFQSQTGRVADWPAGSGWFQNYALSIEFLAGYYLMKVPYQLKAGTVVVWFRFSA